MKGCVLEAAPLPRLPAIALSKVEHRSRTFSIVLDHQSDEDVEVNGSDTIITNADKSQRFPLVMMLDGVVSNSQAVTS